MRHDFERSFGAMVHNFVISFSASADQTTGFSNRNKTAPADWVVTSQRGLNDTAHSSKEFTHCGKGPMLDGDVVLKALGFAWLEFEMRDPVKSHRANQGQTPVPRMTLTSTCTSSTLICPSWLTSSGPVLAPASTALTTR